MAAAVPQAARSFTSSKSWRALKQGAFGVPMGRRCASLASFPACPSCQPALRCRRYSIGGHRHPTSAEGGTPPRRADDLSLERASTALLHAPSSWGRRSLVIPSPPNFVALTVARHRPPVVGCVDEDVAQRAGGTPSTIPSTYERSGSAPMHQQPSSARGHARSSRMHSPASAVHPVRLL